MLVFWALGNNLSKSVEVAVFQQLQQLNIWLHFLELQCCKAFSEH